MKKLTNYTLGPRGVTLKSGAVVWIKPGATVEFEDKKGEDTEIVSKPDLGSKPAAEDDADADALAAALAEIEVLKAQLQSAGKPDYERDGLQNVDIEKPATSKDQLLVIAAYEKADVPQGDDASKAELIKAIKAKRAAA